MAASGPTVLLVVGVNGAGKTTFIGKLAAPAPGQRKRVLVGAADTFRAGAIDQLRVWAERTQADFVGGKAGTDPAAVAFDAIDAGVTRGADVVIIDTAGRLHTSGGLMEELRKVHRVVQKRMPDAPHETLLVLDGTIGQNAVVQARQFAEAVPLTGLVVTKLDSSATGRRGRRGARGDGPAGEVRRCRGGARRPGCRSTRRVRARAGGGLTRGRRSACVPARPACPNGARRSAPVSPDTPVTYSRASGRRAASRSRGWRAPRARPALPRAASLRGREHGVAHRGSRAGMDGTVIGSVISKGVIPTRKGLRHLPGGGEGRERHDGGVLAGAAVPRSHDQQGRRAPAHRHVRFFHGRQLQPREFVNLGAEEQGTGGGRVLSVYPATEGLSFKQIRTLVDTHLDVLLPQVREPLPPDLLALAGVPPLPDALRMVHRPSSIAEALEGRSPPGLRGAAVRAHPAPARERAGTRAP
jgi:hypothetical protein